MRNSHKQEAGFTLIELLIAGIILFTVIVSVASVYRVSSRVSQTAQETLEFRTTLLPLMDTIQFYLRTEKPTSIVTQEGMLNGVRFEWHAKVIDRGAPPDAISETTGEFQPLEERFFLWQVDVVLFQGGRSEAFTFKELTWR